MCADPVFSVCGRLPWHKLRDGNLQVQSAKLDLRWGSPPRTAMTNMQTNNGITSVVLALRWPLTGSSGTPKAHPLQIPAKAFVANCYSIRALASAPTLKLVASGCIMLQVAFGTANHNSSRTGQTKVQRNEQRDHLSKSRNSRGMKLDHLTMVT